MSDRVGPPNPRLSSELSEDEMMPQVVAQPSRVCTIVIRGTQFPVTQGAPPCFQRIPPLPPYSRDAVEVENVHGVMSVHIWPKGCPRKFLENDFVIPEVDHHEKCLKRSMSSRARENMAYRMREEAHKQQDEIRRNAREWTALSGKPMAMSPADVHLR